MSARLDWRPSRNDWRSTTGQSAAADALTRAFYDFPNKLDRDAIPTLRAMAAADPHGPWNALAEAVEEFGEIDLRMTC